MGFDKGSLVVEGKTLIQRALDQFEAAGIPVTVLGQEAVAGRTFKIDSHPGSGPAAALAEFLPLSDLVFVLSCDVPFFVASVVAELRTTIGEHDAAIPLLENRAQYLCALYSIRAFEKWRNAPTSLRGRSMRELIDMIDVVETDVIDARSITGVNCPEELERLLIST